MCSLFGIIDYDRVFTPRRRMKILQVLSRECEVRGTDATGIAYMDGKKLRIQKSPCPARKMHWKFPQHVNILIGHTRMTTQGNELRNQNNHPFASTHKKHPFALAHNGVIWNDKILRTEEHLPDTDIETDSFIAVQLLDAQGEVNFNSIQHMAEKVCGSFCFSILDDESNTYLVKGDNPLALYHFNGYYLYASTDTILKKALRKLGMSRLPFKEIVLNQGDILKICNDGTTEQEHFLPHWDYYTYTPQHTAFAQTYLDWIIENAKSLGYTEDDILMLLDCGYDEAEIEDILYTPSLMRSIAKGREVDLYAETEILNCGAYY